MGATAVTTFRGRRARIWSRVRAVPRCIGRLLFVVGLMWVGCLLLGGTAYASDTPSPSHEPAAETPAPVLDPLLKPTQTLVGVVTESTTSGESPASSRPVAEVPPAATPTTDPVDTPTTTARTPGAVVNSDTDTDTDTAGDTDTDNAGEAPDTHRGTDRAVPTAKLRHLPKVADVVSPVTSNSNAQPRSTVDAAPTTPRSPRTVTDTVTDRAAPAARKGASRAVQTAELPHLPKVADVVSPVVRDLNAQPRSTVDAAADLVEEVTAPVPLAGSMTHLSRTATFDALEGATSLVDVTSYVAAGGVDSLVGQGSAVLAPVLAPVKSLPLQSPTTTGYLGFAGANPSTSGSIQGVPSTTGVLDRAQTNAIPAPEARADRRFSSQPQGGPTVPPPDVAASATSATVQSASAIDTMLAVPVPDAGSTVRGSRSSNGTASGSKPVVPVPGAGSTVSGSGPGSGAASGSKPAGVLGTHLRRPATIAPATEARSRAIPQTPPEDPAFTPD